MAWDKLADEKTIADTVKALKANGIDALVVDNGAEAKASVLGLIPNGAEVFTATSTTASAIGLAKELDESGRYNSVRRKFMKMDRKTQHKEMAALGATPDWVVGSVHAVTRDGKTLTASQSGSQLPAYVYGAKHVVWVVGTQKIVDSLEDGIKRIYEYTLPLEGERAKKAYGAPGSAVNKLLIINKEMQGRITLIFVREKIGF